MNTAKLLTGLLTLGLLCQTTITHAAALKGKNQTFPHGCRVLGYSYQDDILTIKPGSGESTSATQDQAQAQTAQQAPTTAEQQAQLANQVQQTMYLIHNKSGQSIALKAKKEPGELYKPDFENVINSNQWAAFAMDQKQVQFTCTSNSKPVPCENAFEICQYNHAKFSDSTKGSYWVIKGDSLENAVYGAIKIGILLRW